MFAETQQPYDIFTEKELLRRPLEPHTAIAADPDNCQIVDDAFHVQEGEDKHGMYTDITAYIADAALIRRFPALVSDAEYRAFHRFENGVSYQLLPAFVLSQLSLNAPSPHGVPAIAVRTKLRERSSSLVNIERVRVKVNCMTYGTFAETITQSDEQPLALANAARKIAHKRILDRMFVTESDATQMIAVHNAFTNKLVARTIRWTEEPWFYRCHKKAPKKEVYNHALWAAYYSHRPARHDGLMAPQYGQIGSPLRRFPDLANHLNLAAILDNQPLPYTQEKVAKLAQQINEQMHAMRSSILEAA